MGPMPVAPPPRTGMLRGTAKALLGTPVNALITLACLWLLWRGVRFLFDWLVEASVTAGGPRACKAAQGACWPFIMAKLRFMFLGVYPYEEQWRVLLSLTIFGAIAALSMIPRCWGASLALAWFVALVSMALLMWGGVLGLTYVPTSLWSGLPLSLMLASVGLAVGFPVGVLLALARVSSLWAIRWLAIGLVEIVRGVPLITILFMASVMLPLFMPSGVTVDKLLRAQLAIILFAGAYIAETVRGGLQAVARGQYQAAQSLGLHYWHAMRLVVLPQALKVVLPALIVIAIGFFQDTTLVTIIGLLDFLSTVRAAMHDPNWQGIALVEGYVVAGLVYLIISFGLGVYGRFLERRFQSGGM